MLQRPYDANIANGVLRKVIVVIAVSLCVRDRAKEYERVKVNRHTDGE